MKTLLLLRHGKSSRKDTSTRDFDRPLSERGVSDSKLIGEFIRKKKLHSELMISSPAERARQTAELVLKAGLQLELRVDERVYEASARHLFEVISQIEDTANTVLLVGHNPGFEELLQNLSGEERELSTATLACIELSVEKWSRVQASVGNLKWLVAPRELRRD